METFVAARSRATLTCDLSVKEMKVMGWIKPQITDIPCSMEATSYANTDADSFTKDTASEKK